MLRRAENQCVVRLFVPVLVHVRALSLLVSMFLCVFVFGFSVLSTLDHRVGRSLALFLIPIVDAEQENNTFCKIEGCSNEKQMQSASNSPTQVEVNWEKGMKLFSVLQPNITYFVDSGKSTKKSTNQPKTAANSHFMDWERERERELRFLRWNFFRWAKFTWWTKGIAIYR